MAGEMLKEQERIRDHGAEVGDDVRNRAVHKREDMWEAEKRRRNLLKRGDDAKAAPKGGRIGDRDHPSIGDDE